MAALFWILCLLVILELSQLGSTQRLNFYERLVRETETDVLQTILQYPKRKTNVRQQDLLMMSFPCFNSTQFGRSESRPTSVHRLRPGDIDIIGAMGDSLVAGNGAMEEFALGNIIEHRGISWCAGGEGSWRKYLTLPNILKEFNPNLRGYSTGIGEFFTRNAQLNVAFPVAGDSDALKQAKLLVKKIKKLKGANFKSDWKMITVFFGANDLCSAQCFNKTKGSPQAHARKLMVALDYIQAKLPRTFVNLIPVLDVSVSLRIPRTLMCRLMHRLYCTCFHQIKNPMAVMTELARQYQKAEEDLIMSGRYDKKEDFTVVIQPFIKLYNYPVDRPYHGEDAINITYITHDCFHFSQKGHALGANMLWNNLLQPVGSKSISSLNYIMEKFKCPTTNAPYLFTNKNSLAYRSTGHQ